MRSWGERNPQEEVLLRQAAGFVFVCIMVAVSPAMILMTWCGYTFTEVVDLMFESILPVALLVLLLVRIADSLLCRKIGDDVDLDDKGI